MQIIYLGTPAPEFNPNDWPEVSRPVRYTGQPPFTIDALMLFADAAANDEGANAARRLHRIGRPIIRFGAVNLPVGRDANANVLLLRDYAASETASYVEWIASRPRTNYAAIDCNFYDNFEDAIVRKDAVQFEYVTLEGEVETVQEKLLDLKTHLKEEYVKTAGKGWLRLDRIASVNDRPAGASCRF